MTLQYLLQVYLTSYTEKKKYIIKFAEWAHWYAIGLALVQYIIIIIISTLFSKGLRPRPALYIPLYIYLSLLQMFVYVMGGKVLPNVGEKTPSIISWM